MENKLLQLFDCQRFLQNPRLSKIINDAESRYASASLADDELEFVSAAGDPDALLNTEAELLAGKEPMIIFAQEDEA